MAQDVALRRLGGRGGAVAPAMGIKCTTAEIRLVNEVVEECLEGALEDLEEPELVVVELEDMEELTVDGCRVVNACLSCTDLR